MRCNRVRRQIQSWFDTPGAPPMPAKVKEHIRDCMPCRDLITRWNAIEIQLQSLQGQTPNLSPDFTFSLQSRLRAEAAGIRRPWIARYWQLALTGASTAVLILFLALRLLNGAHQPMHAPNMAAAQNPTSARNDTAQPSLSTDLPLANTR